MNPDGTCQMVYYGNQFPGTVMLDAKPIPGTDKIVASFSPGHGRPEHMGEVTIVDPNTGPDWRPAARRISRPRQAFRDPYAISEDCFLVANWQGILVMDGSGNTEPVYRFPRTTSPSGYPGFECHEPRPLRPRPREKVLPPRVDTKKADGLLVLQDVYRGRNMAGVKQGEIKKLLVLEQLPKPVNFSGGMQPLTIGGTFTMARILGTVPVEPDGSAYLKAPALRSLFFVALDGNELSVKRMQSFCILEPGETTSCVGCHEERRSTPAVPSGLLAMRRPPSRIEPIPGVPDVYDFPRDIQPILNRHCVECHNPDRRDGKVDLTGDHTPLYTASYWTMINHRLISDGRNQPIGSRAPRTIGSSASRLLKLMDGGHHGVKPSRRERVKRDLSGNLRRPGLRHVSGAIPQPGEPLRLLPWTEGSGPEGPCLSVPVRRILESAVPLQFDPTGEVTHPAGSPGAPGGWPGTLRGDGLQGHDRSGLPEAPRRHQPIGGGAAKGQALRHARIPPERALHPRDEALRDPPPEPGSG
jgi:hypothetical protein